MTKSKMTAEQREDAQIEAHNAANAASLPPLPQPTPAQMADLADAASPTSENAPPHQFVPGSGISSLDLYEITLMQLVDMTGSQVQFEPGTLRGILMSGHRVEQLSESARRFMKQQAQPAPAIPEAK